MHAALVETPRRSRRRALYGVLAAALLAAIAVELARHGTGWWQLVAFGAGPDLALLAGAGSGRFVGPVAMLAAVAVLDLGAGWAVGGLAWAFHVALDRAVGYGLRTRDGFQRA
jgi:hypothetical protein